MHPPASEWLPLIQRIKNDLKRNEVFREMCAEHDFDPEDIDLIPVRFDNIEVSGKTEHGVVTLNWELLNDIDKLKSILVHESDHYVSQSIEPTQSADDGPYLDNEEEISAFQTQLEYIDSAHGPQAANRYVEQVLDHHQETGRDRQYKKELLMEKIDACIREFHALSRRG